jgi:hypothetical protein
MDPNEPTTSDGCRERAQHCASAADRTSNEHVRQLLQSMQKMWLKLATETERLETGTSLVLQQSQSEQAATNEPDRTQAARAIETQRTVTGEKPKSRLLANAPQCSRCNTTMKVRTLRPGRKVDVVAYRCEECGEEVVVDVKRVW